MTWHFPGRRGQSIDPGTPQPAMLDVVSGVGSGSGMDGADGLMESLGGSESSPSAEDILGERDTSLFLSFS